MENNNVKTEVYNLIILDESGSMDCIKAQTISGCNETINTIRSTQAKMGDAQNHFVSIFAFQSDGTRPSRYLIKNVPARTVEHINSELYDPWGCTPLYDAIGSTLTDLKAVVKRREAEGHCVAIGCVTIITDGMENSSHHYTRGKVARMISALKELGWNFNFIGANIDVDNVASGLNIDNRMAFMQDEAGTREMFRKEKRARARYCRRMQDTFEELKSANAPQSVEDEMSMLRMSSSFACQDLYLDDGLDDFDDDEKEDTNPQDAHPSKPQKKD